MHTIPDVQPERPLRATSIPLPHESARSAADDQQPAALGVVTTLLEHLDAAGIRYCHWKSTHSLPRALRGETDLDLLVDRGESGRFKELLYQLDFKPVLSHPSRQFPAIEDFLGFDRETGRLVHLHIHYRLVLGEQFAKNYYLPLEQFFLDNTREDLGIKAPAPALELIVLVMRALLKYRDRDALRDLLGIGEKSGIPPAILNECRHLLAQTTTEQIERALREQVRFLSPKIVFSFLKTIEHAPRDGLALLRLRKQVRRALAPFQRYSRLRARSHYYRIMLTRTWPVDRVLRRFFVGQDKRKIPLTGGLTLAFVGADGAGKSTVAKHIAKWLSWRLNVRTYYMGSAQPSFTTSMLKRASKIARFVAAGSRRVLGDSGVTRRVDQARQYLEALRFVAEGRDRYRRYRRSRRKAAQGAIIIYDRYPLDAIRVFNHSADGPRIAARSNGRMDVAARKLARAEERLYHDMLPPEHVFVLHVSPDVSQARKPEHKRDLIEAKSQATQQIARAGIDVIDIDADQPLDQVLLQVKAAVWRLL